MEKAREARTVGILMGTLGVDKYLDIVKHLKKVIKTTGKKVGQVNILGYVVYLIIKCSNDCTYIWCIVALIYKQINSLRKGAC